jgi:hypothetical protein
MNGLTKFARWTACAAVIAGIVPASPVQAYRLIQNLSTGRVTGGSLVTCTDPNGFAHWGSSNINWYHNTAGQGAGKAAALYNAMVSWTSVSSDNHSLTYAGTTGAGFATDGVNTLSWGSSGLCGSFNGCLALTALDLQSGQVIVETDVIFSSDWTWTTNGTNYDTEAVAAHELGHTLGIHHSEVSTATMWATYFGANERSLETDDRSAIQCSQTRYPPTANCVPNGGVDDSGFSTSCCSGAAISGITYCPPGGDCSQICATPLVGGCVPSGGIDDTLSRTSCCSGAAVPGSTRCLNPADYNNGWSSCIQTCL